MTMLSLSSHKRPLSRFALIAMPAVLLLLGGCGTSSRTTIGATDVPQAFRANCVSCHGADLQGRMGASTNLTKVGQRMTKDGIVKQIKQGGGGMPAFGSRLSDAQIQALASWLSAKK